MSNPNFQEYVDFTVFDLDADEVYEDAVEYAQTSFPEFTPRLGTVENALLEATSFQTAYMVDAANRLPNGLMEGLLKLMGFNRISATPSEGTVTFDVTVNTGVTISAGTVVSFDVSVDGVLTQFLFETINDLVIASGNTSGTTAVEAVTPSEYPDIPIGSPLTLVSTSPFIFDMTLASLSTKGTDAETDDEYFSRGATFLGSLNRSLATASQMTDYIATTYPTVARFKVYDLTQAKQTDVINAVLAANTVTLTTRYAHELSVGNSVVVAKMTNAVYNGTYTVVATPTSTTFTYSRTNANIASAATTVGHVYLANGMQFATANVGGAVSVSMCDSEGEPISVAQKLIIEQDLELKTVAGLKIYMHDTHTFAVDVAISVKTLANFSTASVSLAVSKVIEDYLSINGWDFESSIDQRKLSAMASKVDGVSYVVSVVSTLPSAVPLLATAAGGDVTLLQKGTIPIGNCTTTAT